MALLLLIACILLNTYVGIVFKFFERFGISNKQAIAVNYWVCVCTGILFSGVNPLAAEYTNAPFFKWGLFNGFFYFVIFIFIALSTVKNGVATTQVANRLSLVIPVLLMFLLYNEQLTMLKIVGILLAVAAVFFTSYAKDAAVSNNFLLPIIIFFGSGLLDFVASSVQRNYLHNSQQANAFLITCFGMAAVCSSLYLTYLLYTRVETFAFKNILAGLILGFPNYFSIYLFIKALESKILKPTALIPVNNISVVLVSTFVALLFFKEKMGLFKKFGIVLAIAAIVCIVLGDAL
jgi:drug/metabolite transporter (DMT)-like permease